jgi:UMF1 family MFS transporter
MRQRLTLRPGVRPAEVWAWAMYDFANSGYTTVVITAIFNAYFVAVVAGNAPWATFAWTATLAASYLALVVTSPVVGAYADAQVAKKRLLALTTVGCVACTALLAFAGPGDLWIAIVLVALSNYFFGSGENIVAAFVPELAEGHAVGRVSGWGWALGYVGGLVTLGLCLAWVIWAGDHGAKAPDYVPVTMLITAAIFAIASLPTFIVLRERGRTHPEGGAAPVTAAFARVAYTLRRARHYRDLWRFLLCLVFYQAGIQTVIALAAIYAQEAMGFGTKEILVLIMIVNITAALGALAFGHVQDWLGHRPTLFITLAGWMVTILIAWAAQGPALFWLAANLVGVCLGSSQSAGRALIAYLSPARRRAEFFGLWGLAVKLSSILGPLSYGAVTWATGGDHRLAILCTVLFFVAGFALLLAVDVERGHRAAGGDAERQDNLL